MKVLRLKLYQPQAHYRIPFTVRRRHTYPIPPYSTVIGLICNVLGIKDHSEENFRALKTGLSLAIYGNFESMTKEYIWFRNLKTKFHIGRFYLPKNRKFYGIPEHPGGQMPMRIDVLENVKLLIYVYHPDEQVLKILKNAFLNPINRASPLHLGRAEDWIVFDRNPEEAIKIIEIDCTKKEPFYGKFNFYTWIPDPEQGIEFIDENLYDKDKYTRFYRKIKGSSHLITSFYEIKAEVREFIRIPVKLFEQGDFPFDFGRPFDFVKDRELNIPLFFCKMYKEKRV